MNDHYHDAMDNMKYDADAWREEAEAASELAPSETAGPAKVVAAVATGSAVGGEYYQGIEWLACWLLDNAEGETITEESLRPWAVAAWHAHLKRQNDKLTHGCPL